MAYADRLDRDPEAGQKSSVTVAADGLNCTPIDAIVAGADLRVFAHGDRWFAIDQSGRIARAG